MILSYFDENKFSEDRPFFYIGGLMVPDTSLTEIEDTLATIVRNYLGTSLLTKDTELHGKELWHRKGPFKKMEAKTRLNLLQDLVSVITTHKLAVRMVCIDVHEHRSSYKFPEPEYSLGLMLLLEGFCNQLERANDIGLVFGDHEEDEYSRAISDFSAFKGAGRTPMYRGRSLERLKDTIYYTRSHHSRFLQLADIIAFLAQRFDKLAESPSNWLEAQGWELWNKLKKGSNYAEKCWP